MAIIVVMTEQNQKVTITRQGLRVLILFAVFLLCVGAAWWMALHRGQSLIAGQTIISEMRKQKLSSYWPRQEETHWYLIKQGGKNIGWLAKYRKPTQDGGFEGGQLEMKFSPQGPDRMASKWKLNDEATAGRYLSDVSILGQVKTNLGVRMIKRPLLSASIEMKDGRLYVKQTIKGSYHPSEADEPEAYTPEGTSELVAYLAAKKQTHAKFRMIIDGIPPQEGYTTFLTIDVTPADAQPVSHQGLVVAVSLGDGEQLYFFDKNGKLEKIVNGEQVETAVTEEEMLQAFPEAIQTLKNFEQS